MLLITSGVLVYGVHASHWADSAHRCTYLIDFVVCVARGERIYFIEDVSDARGMLIESCCYKQEIPPGFNANRAYKQKIPRGFNGVLADRHHAEIILKRGVADLAVEFFNVGFHFLERERFVVVCVRPDAIYKHPQLRDC